jgi:hypothetical protein
MTRIFMASTARDNPVGRLTRQQAAWFADYLVF